jgi:hypothetical protein
MLLVDSGLDGLEGSVSYCDDCDDVTIHLGVPDGVSVCNQCGDSPLWDELDGEDSDD